MSVTNSKYAILREKLDILGYNQTLPANAVPLVGVVFEDFIKTTESLRDAKLEIMKLLEEKSCWELGIEPYKCDNSRLLSECNSLHLELLKQKDEFEEKICDYRQKIRSLESDRRHLEEHNRQLEKNVRELLSKTSASGVLKTSKNDVNMSRKPFISTVKAGAYIPNPIEPANAYRCAKCSSIVWTKHIEGKVQEVQLLQIGLQSAADEITSLKEKLERRDREINRLASLLSGGRPIEALAKDCCYKNVGTLSEDVEDLQKEKVELIRKYRDAQNSMHEAMQRAIALEEKNKNLERELDDFQKEALSVETEANTELSKKQSEILSLRKELIKVKNLQEKEPGKSSEDKRKLYEQLNLLTQREKEFINELEKLKKKNAKLKSKISIIQTTDTSHHDNATSQLTILEDEIKRFRNERDFFQKEYLKIVEQSVSLKEVEILKSQLESKDNELKSITKDLLNARYQSTHDENHSISSQSVQAVIMRAEREHDVLKEELRLLRMERDRLREKLDYAGEAQVSERVRLEEENRLLQSRNSKLEAEKRELITSQIPERTQLTLVKEELEEMKRRIQDLQSENHKLSTTNNQLRILQDQTEKALIDHQNRLLAAETSLENRESQLNAVSSTRESVRSEVNVLQREISILKANNSSLEMEKDKIMSELDTKTESIYKLEHEMKILTKHNQDLHSKLKTLEKKLSDTANRKQEYESELHETSTESRSLREQIGNIKLSREETLAENCRLRNDLAEITAESRQFKSKLKDSEKEVEKLKQQLQQYVQEVKRAEELLLSKEQEREEMLEHYRSLSHDAVLLEGNNQSLEIEAAEHKQQLLDAQLEVTNLKQELAAKEECISKLENQVSILSSQIAESQGELEQNYDELRLTKVDLEASKELIAKLDVQRDKLRAELEESKNIICQLETEIKEQRERMMNMNSQERVPAFSLEELLCSTRIELEQQRKKTSQLNQDINLLRETINELEGKLCGERKKSQKNETLAKEYSIKIQELQQVVTNNRFEQNRSQENSPSIISSNVKPCYSICPYKPTVNGPPRSEISSTKPDEQSALRIFSRAFIPSVQIIKKNSTSGRKGSEEQNFTSRSTVAEIISKLTEKSRLKSPDRKLATAVQTATKTASSDGKRLPEQHNNITNNFTKDELNTQQLGLSPLSPSSRELSSSFRTVAKCIGPDDFLKHEHTTNRSSVDEKIARHEERVPLQTPSRAFASSFQAITKYFSPEEKQALQQDIKEFLNSEKGTKDSFYEYDEKISLDEEGSEIVVRRKRTIRTKVGGFQAHQEHSEEISKAISNSVPSSSNELPLKHTDPSPATRKRAGGSKIVSHMSITSRSLSPRSFSPNEESGKNKQLKIKTRKGDIKLQPVLSDPETIFSKSLLMKTNHRFKGNLDFTTAVKFKISPRRKDQQRPKTIANLGKKRKKTDDKELELSPLELKSTARMDTSSVDNTSKHINQKQLMESESKDSNYPISSTTDTMTTYCAVSVPDTSSSEREKLQQDEEVKKDSSLSVIHIPPKIPVVVVPDSSSSSESKYYSLPEKSSQEEQKILKQEPPTDSRIIKSSNLVEEEPEKRATMNALDLASIETTTGCSCMKSKKMQILATYNVPLHQPPPINIYYRRLKLCRSPSGYETRSSSGSERPKTSRIPNLKKKIDMSKLPPPPPFHERDK